MRQPLKKNYRELAIFHGTVNSVNVASRFVNVTVSVAVAVIFAVVWTPPKEIYPHGALRKVS